MNAIGVDYQSSRCVVALREGIGYPPRIRSVGDGVRAMIPIPAASSSAEAELAFWRSLATRLYSFLGHVQPIAENGYEIVVATPDAADRIGDVADAVGLPDHSCVTPSDALVARWLTEMTGWKEERGVAVEWLGRRAERGHVVAITVGDSQTTIASYDVGDTERGLPRVDRGPRREVDSGYRAWLQIFFDRVREQLAEVGDVTHDATLFDSAAEFGAKLRATPPGKLVEWRGPWPDRLYAPLRVTRAECESWGAVREWSQSVAAAVGDLVLDRSGRSLARILVGGIGAVWPFAGDAVAKWGAVWQTSAPWLDLAAGAAWWPEVRFCFSGEPDLARPLAIPDEPLALAEPVPFPRPADPAPVLTPFVVPPEPADVAPLDLPASDVDLNGDNARPEAANQVEPPSHDDLPPWERFGEEPFGEE